MKAILIASIATSLAAAVLASVDSTAAASPLLPDWKDAPDEFKQGVEAQVQAYINDPELTPAAVYGAWLDQRQADGWTFGEKLDTDKKQSPSIVPWSQAPMHRRVLETLLHASANTLKNLPDEASAQLGVRPAADSVKGRDVAPTQIVAPDGFVMIEYVGRRDIHKDNLYGTGTVWQKGETKPIPAVAAAQMLRHPDVYAVGKAAAATEAAPPPQAKKEDSEEDHTQEVRDSINAMRSKASVREFIKTNYQQDVGEDKSLADLKAQAIQLVDQFGITR